MQRYFILVIDYSTITSRLLCSTSMIRTGGGYEHYGVLYCTSYRNLALAAKSWRPLSSSRDAAKTWTTQVLYSLIALYIPSTPHPSITVSYAHDHSNCLIDRLLCHLRLTNLHTSTLS